MNRLLCLRLSTGTYEIEVRNEKGEVKNVGELDIKNKLFSNSIGISHRNELGEIKVDGGAECLTVKIAF